MFFCNNSIYMYYVVHQLEVKTVEQAAAKERKRLIGELQWGRQEAMEERNKDKSRTEKEVYKCKASTENGLGKMMTSIN